MNRCVMLVAAAALGLVLSPGVAAQDNQLNTFPRPLAAVDSIAIPRLINYQGMLTDTSGEPENDTLLMTFRIFDGTTEIWSETRAEVVVQNGVFEVLLGSVRPIDSLPEAGVCSLGIVVDGEPMVPRIPLVSVPYAYNAAQADNADKLDGFHASEFLNAANDFGRSGVASNLYEGTQTLTVRYVNEGQGNSVADTMIQANAVDSTRIRNSTIGRSDVTPGFKAPYADTADYARVAAGGSGTVTAVRAGTGTITSPDPIRDSGSVSLDEVYTDSVYVNASGDSVSGSLVVQNLLRVYGKANVGPACYNPGDFTFVAGSEDSARGNYSTIAGGWKNAANGFAASIGGGQLNAASGTNSRIGGGYSNAASGMASTIAGGFRNTVTSASGAIGGGDGNAVSGIDATIGGGAGNTASGDYTTVSGGFANRADTASASVGGGVMNRAQGENSFVGGGSANLARGKEATVCGGFGDTATALSATIGGGRSNRADSSYATVGGGLSNSAGGLAATVGGGQGNFVTGRYAAVPGGYYDTCLARAALCAGYSVRVQDPAQYTFAFGSGFSTSTPYAVVFYHGGQTTKLGVGVTDPTHNIDAAAGAYCDGANWVNASRKSDWRDVRKLTTEECAQLLAELSRTDVFCYRHDVGDSHESDPAGEKHVGLSAEQAPATIATPGRDGINTGDAIGFLFAALKAQHLAFNDEIAALKARVAALEQSNRPSPGRETRFGK